MMNITPSQSSVSAPAVLFEPEFYLFDVSADLKLAKFLITDIEKLDLAPFIDIRFEPLARGNFWLPVDELIRMENTHSSERPNSVFIFHHAFVCSTLLTRCLSQTDAFFGLKEPWIFRRLADIKRANHARKDKPRWDKLFHTFLSLLEKNYGAKQKPLIKMTNVANNLASDVMRIFPSHKILYLYSDLSNFLVSNIKKPRDTQVKMPGLAQNFLKDSDFVTRFPEFCNVSRLNFFQICALIWLLNLYSFKSNAESMSKKNIKALEMNNLLADLEGSLEELCDFFEYKTSTAEIEQMIAPSITQTDAKHQNRKYNAELKKAEYNTVIERFGTEIRETQHWITPIVEETGIFEYFSSLSI